MVKFMLCRNCAIACGGKTTDDREEVQQAEVVWAVNKQHLAGNISNSSKEAFVLIAYHSLHSCGCPWH
jgi:hypothetical protein